MDSVVICWTRNW